MKILHPTNAVRTAHRVRQLSATYPVECAKALAAQPEAIAMVGSAMKELAQDIEAAFIFSEALRADRELQRCAREFYAAERRVQRPLPRKWHDHLKALVLGQMIESILLETVAI
ncbi:MAG: hypothetical protein ABI583_00175 [Betaproteobacteria bacterium]